MYKNKFVIFLFFSILGAGCNPKEMPDKPTYKASLFSDVISKNQTTLDSLRTVDFPQSVDLNSDWMVITTDERQGLEVNPPEFKTYETLNLPHRIPKPNSPFWYHKNITLGNGVLVLNADDGAQVWINGKRVSHLFGEIFPFESNGGEVEVTIRVLNNAMRGGLRWVKWVSQKDWKDYQNKVQGQDSLWVQTRKRDLYIGNLPEKPEDYPALRTDPVWLKSESGEYFIRWVSEQEGEASFRWGEDSLKLGHSQNVNSANGTFVIPFQETNTTLFYQIQQGKTVSPLYKIDLRQSSDSLRFAVWGDSQGGWDVFRQLIDLMNIHEPSFSLGAGDLVSNGSDEKGYLNLLQSLSQANFYHYPVVGNHDYDGYYENLIPQNYHDLVGIPRQKTYGFWREGNTAFIALDPNENFPVGIPEGSEQYNWFISKINSDEWNSAEWKFIVLHQPPYSQGWPGYHGEQSILDLLAPYFERAKIDAVIAGHSHNYERLISQAGNQKVAFLVVGGAGGGLEPEENSPWPEMDVVVNKHHFGLVTIYGKKLTFEVFDLDNQLIDHFELDH